MIKGILIGQMVSLLNTCTGVFTSLLLENSVNTPLFQLFWSYLLILLVYLCLSMKKRGFVIWSQARKCVLAALCDPIGNFLVILGLRYTSFISVSALINLSVVLVMVLSYTFLKVKIRLHHILGASICLLGLCCVLISDLWANDWVWGGNIFGDILVLLGAMFLAISNVAIEYLMTSSVRYQEYLVADGCVGTFVTLVTCFSLELGEIQDANSAENVGYYIGFAVVILLLYSIIPRYIQKFGATMFNLSLMTNMFYSLIFGIFLFGSKLTWLYLVGFCFIITGIVIYNKPEKKSNDIEFRIIK